MSLRWIIGLLLTTAIGFGLVLGPGLVGRFIARASYQPPTAVATWGRLATMTPDAVKLYYGGTPALDGMRELAASCTVDRGPTGILGCYTSDGSIHLLDFSAAQYGGRLDGLAATVAAHEMLHAAWASLDGSTKSRVDKLLDAEADAMAGNADFASRMAQYQKAEPGERYNELHSIIATEYLDISPELEKYYSRYFTDRAAMVQGGKV